MLRTALVFITLLQSAVLAQPARLTEDAVVKAIALGQSKSDIKSSRVGRRAVLVRSSLQYEIGRLYTAASLIAVEARAAAAAYREFSAASVSEERRTDVLTFIVPPFKASAMDAREAETVIVMPKGSKDPAKVIRPLSIHQDVSTYQNAFGASWQVATVVAVFDREVATQNFEFVVVYRGGKELRGDVVDPLLP